MGKIIRDIQLLQINLLIHRSYLYQAEARQLLRTGIQLVFIIPTLENSRDMVLNFPFPWPLSCPEDVSHSLMCSTFLLLLLPQLHFPSFCSTQWYKHKQGICNKSGIYSILFLSENIPGKQAGVTRSMNKIHVYVNS